MKSIATFIAFATLSVCAQEVRDIRTINGRIVDVTAAVAAGPNSAYSNYWVSGDTLLNYPKTLFIERNEGYRWFARPLYPGASNSEILSHLSAIKITGTNGVKNLPGGLLLFGDGTRRFEQREVIQCIAIMNHNSDADRGRPVSILAMPIPSRTFRIELQHRHEITPLCFDAGIPYDISTNTAKYYHVLTPTGLREAQFSSNHVHMAEKKEAATLTKRIITTNSVSDR